MPHPKSNKRRLAVAPMIIGMPQATAAVARAVRTGQLTPATAHPCTDCGYPEAVQYDHRDYNKPLVVEPVCRSCNVKRSAAIPLRGAMTKLISMGLPVYVHHHQACHALLNIGIDIHFMEEMLSRLTIRHWRKISQYLPDWA